MLRVCRGWHPAIHRLGMDTPFHTKVVNVGVRDSTYVLDGLLYHESDLRIEEHYTDTAGFTDHVFALMHLLGFRFAPRIRDLGDDSLLQYLSPLGWEHINLTGDYLWRRGAKIGSGKFRPLRSLQTA